MRIQKGRRRFLKYLSSILAFGAGSVLAFNKIKRLKPRKSGLIFKNRAEAGEIDHAGYEGKIIAVEEHFTTEKILNYLASRIKSGAEFNMPIPYDVSAHSQSLIGDKRLRDMDEAGIGMQVISSVCFQDGLIDPSEATALAKLTNDELYGIIKKYPKRFAGFAGLACQDPEAAATELERAVKDLGLRGAMIYSHIQGEYLDDRKFRVIFDKAEELGVPIYLHPKEPTPGMIEPYLKYSALSGAMWGYAAETGLHAMRLIASGLFDEYPGLKMILGHGGEALPFWLWRMDRHGIQQQSGEEEDRSNLPPGASAPLLCKKKPGQYVKDNFLVTTSGMFWEPVLLFLHLAMGSDKMLFAVDYPAESNSLAVETVASLPISNSDKEKIFHGNAEELLRL